MKTILLGVELSFVELFSIFSGVEFTFNLQYFIIRISIYIIILYLSRVAAFNEKGDGQHSSIQRIVTGGRRNIYLKYLAKAIRPILALFL